MRASCNLKRIKNLRCQRHEITNHTGSSPGKSLWYASDVLNMTYAWARHMQHRIMLCYFPLSIYQTERQFKTAENNSWDPKYDFCQNAWKSNHSCRRHLGDVHIFDTAHIPTIWSLLYFSVNPRPCNSA